MKHLQSAFVSGHVRLTIRGENPEQFVQMCTREGIIFWNMISTGHNACEVNVKLKDIHKLRSLKRGQPYKISFLEKKGYPFLLARLLKRKAFLVAIILSFFLIVCLSNILWKITITGVSLEMEQKIQKQLQSYGITRGTFTFSMDASGIIQQNLTEDIPELLWVGVEKKGATFEIEGIEKTVVSQEEKKGPRDLVATKKGIIKDIYVSKGLPKVKVNDFVEPGKVLVSGNLKDKSKEEDKDADETTDEWVAAEAEITAHTWYETTVEVPLFEKYELLTGKRENKHHLQIGTFKIPIWGFGSSNYKQSHKDIEHQPIYFFKWKLPISHTKSTISEKTYKQIERSVDEAVQTGIEQAKHDLKLELGVDAKIISDKILHQSTQSGKVNLNLHIVVEEDIVKEVPIDQGD